MLEERNSQNWESDFCPWLSQKRELAWLFPVEIRTRISWPPCRNTGQRCLCVWPWVKWELSDLCKSINWCICPRKTNDSLKEWDLTGTRDVVISFSLKTTSILLYCSCILWICLGSSSREAACFQGRQPWLTLSLHGCLVLIGVTLGTGVLVLLCHAHS